jgi:TRAP-type C4-dicarboxylate transport system permease small subunit
MLERLERRWVRILDIVEGLGRVLVVLLTGAVVVQVVSRVLHVPLAWSVEASRVLFAWLGFLGIVITIRRGEVPSFHVLCNKLPARAQHLLGVFTTVLILVFLASMFFATFRIVKIAHTQSMGILPFQWSYVYISLPISLFMLFVTFTLRLLRLLSGAVSPRAKLL